VSRTASGKTSCSEVEIIDLLAGPIKPIPEPGGSIKKWFGIRSHGRAALGVFHVMALGHGLNKSPGDQ
jgi:hypothetical protein